MKKNNKYIFYILGGLFFLFVVIYKDAVDWATDKFGITIKEILYTVASPLDGADSGFLKDAIIYCIPSVVGVIIIFVSYILFKGILSRKLTANIIIKSNKKELSISIYKLFRNIFVIVSVISLCITSIKANETYKVTDFIAGYINKTTIYEDYYINPNSVTIKSPEKHKNLIYIYLESMETTYASTKDGGYQTKINYIPNLTKIARDNISFSNSEKLGGFLSLTGTGWTMSSLFATTSGIPFSFPIDGNSMGEREKFAGGITSLGDILEQKGYRQKFLCGSDGDFAGRKKYFDQHGNYDVFDIYSARAAGYIPNNYNVWWGYEDLHLYEIAKSELTELSKDSNTPFNFTMLTVDTHHIDGYVCEKCPSGYENQLGNVLSCADSQIYEFLEWCKQQPFYEDTVIIITGDHPRMDTSLVSDVPYLERTIYNCFINTDKDIDSLNLKNRVYTAMDIFPTTLSALNFEIEGNKLGLGTDMFSSEKTLAEEIGVEVLDGEINKYSKYYVENFS